MPELPEITVYLEALDRFVVRRIMLDAVIRCLFLPRAFDPEIGGSRGQIASAARFESLPLS